MVNIIESVHEKMFSEIDVQDEGFVLIDCNDRKDFSKEIIEFTKIARQNGFVLIDEPWKVAYKIPQNNGKVSIVLVAKNCAADLNLPKWLMFRHIQLNGIPVGKYFGQLSAFHKQYLDQQKKQEAEKTEKTS